jgi:hypothetical protein
MCDSSTDRTYCQSCHCAVSSDTNSAAAGYLEKIHDSQLLERKTPGRHVMGSNAYVTSDSLSWIIQAGVQPGPIVT